MDEETLQLHISQAVHGNGLAREQLIRRFKPFILNTVGHISNKYVNWSNEEASIGLISFNRAIDTYDPTGGRSFRNYVYLLIKRDLIDFFRRETKEQHFSFEAAASLGQTGNPYENQKSLESYGVSLESESLVEEILELNEELARFEISFEELEGYCPKHQDTRNTLIKMASAFVREEAWIKELFQKKRFPVSSFTKATKYHPKMIERHRKYLITLILLNLHPEWRRLYKFVSSASRGEES